MKTGVDLIADERRRQVDVEGWTAEHDDKHGIGELASAAVCYAVCADCLANGPEMMGERFKGTPESLYEEIMSGAFGEGVSWPWEPEWLKLSPDPLRNLVKAGALIVAEIDRLQRRAAEK